MCKAKKREEAFAVWGRNMRRIPHIHRKGIQWMTLLQIKISCFMPLAACVENINAVGEKKKERHFFYRSSSLVFAISCSQFIATKTFLSNDSAAIEPFAMAIHTLHNHRGTVLNFNKPLTVKALICAVCACAPYALHNGMIEIEYNTSKSFHSAIFTLQKI